MLNCLDSFKVSSWLWGCKCSHDDVIKLLKGIRISNIFSFQGHRTLNPRSKFILKNLILNSKLNSGKLWFNTPLSEF